MTKNTSLSQEPIHTVGVVFYLGISVFFVLLVRTAWQADDAYTAWRLVDNFVNGFGLRNNIDERVQTFTSTLWTFLNAGVYYFTRNIYYTSVGLSIICSLLAVWIAAKPYRNSVNQLLFLFSAVILSLSFMDFSVGGFENPLGHLILATFVYFYFFKFENHITSWRFTLLFFIATLAVLNRVDAAAFYVFPMLYLFIKFDASFVNKVKCVLIAASPLILWHVIALIYFGFPLQNAAYAKRFNGIPTLEFIRAGIDYYINSLSRDPITLVTAVGALIVAFKEHNPKLRLFGLGIIFYMIYVLYVGGGYMSGRFFTMIYFASILLILRSKILEEIEVGRVVVAAIVLLGLLAVNPTFTTRKDYGSEPNHGITSEWLDKGIADERASWYPNSGFLFASRQIQMPKPSSWWDFNQAVKSFVASMGEGPCVGTLVPAGYASYFVPRECHVYDLNGQVDPLMARIPIRYNKNWKQGHFFKPEIPGYRETLISGVNKIQDLDIAEYYDKLRIITRDEIWSWERMKTIAYMNFGKYNYLLQSYAKRNNISWENKLSNGQMSNSGYKFPLKIFSGSSPFQRFQIDRPNLHAISITFVTWGNKQDSYPIDWELIEIQGQKHIPIANGTFDSKFASDWKPYRLTLPANLESLGRTYEIRFHAKGKLEADQVVGIPLFLMAASDDKMQAVVLKDEEIDEKLIFKMAFEYFE